VYSNNDPPIRRLLARNVARDGVCISSSVVTSNVIGRPTQPICSYTKKITYYDIHSGTLVLLLNSKLIIQVFMCLDCFLCHVL
jgi:hypothetical protein